MNQSLPSSSHRFFTKTAGLTAFAALTVVTLAATSALGQGDIPGGTIGSTGGGPYNYSLTFSDSASSTSPIGSIWYGWIPGFFYLPATPASASAPAGWTATIDGNSIQFVASSATYDITAGQSLSGFNYQATFSPATLASTPNSGTSVAYTGGLFSDAGVTFGVQVVPEPSTLALLAVSAATLAGLARRRKIRAG